MSKVIWTLSENDKNEIQELFEKKTALENLVKAIDPSNEIIYNKLVTDYSKITSLFQKWWSETSKKYNWVSGEHWSVNFDTNEVTVE